MHASHFSRDEFTSAGYSGLAPLRTSVLFRNIPIRGSSFVLGLAAIIILLCSLFS